MNKYRVIYTCIDTVKSLEQGKQVTYKIRAIEYGYKPSEAIDKGWPTKLAVLKATARRVKE